MNITDTMFCANLPNHVAGEITGSGIEFLDSCPDCHGDINGDDQVGVTDLLIVIDQWGTCDGDCSADFNGDGQVGVNDLLIVLDAWGPCP